MLDTYRITRLEDRLIRTTWYETIAAGTTGVIVPPTGGTLVMNQWPGNISAKASTITAGEIPTGTAPQTAGGVDITVTMSSTGAWSLSGTPSAYPIAIIYYYDIKLYLYSPGYSMDTAIGWGLHSRQHAITSASDHTSTATAGKVLKADANGLPVETDYIDLLEITPPAAPAANYLRLYTEDFHGITLYSFVDSTGMVRKIVRDSVFVARAEVNITKGQAVYAYTATGDCPNVGLAKSDSSTTMPCIGLAVENITANGYGRIMQVGLLENFNTSAFDIGNVLYVSKDTAGALTATAPLYPNIRQEIATVLVDSVGAGALQVIGRSMFQDSLITSLGALATDINMNTHQLTSLSVPDASGEAIRQTAKITEALLESATDLKHTQNTDTGTTQTTFTIDSGAATKLILTGGSNTFNITNGTAKIDLAAGADVNIDDDMTISAELHVEAATHVNQDLTTDAGPTFDHLHTATITAPAASLVLKPTADATTAIQLADQDGNAVLTVDTTNDRVGIGVTPAYPLHVTKTGMTTAGYVAYFTGTANIPDTSTVNIICDFVTFTDYTIPSGKTNSGYFNAASYRNYINQANYQGTLGSQTGLEMSTGILSCGAGGTVTACYGQQILVYNNDADGTIGTGIGLIVSNIGTTGTMTNRYGIRIMATGGSGTLSKGIDIGAMSGTDTTKHGICIGAMTGASTTNYGLEIGNISGATTNYAIYTGTGLVRFGGAFGCNAATPQTSYVVGAAAPAGGTGATAGAYDTAAHRDSLITLVNNIRTALINNGIAVAA